MIQALGNQRQGCELLQMLPVHRVGMATQLPLAEQRLKWGYEAR